MLHLSTESTLADVGYQIQQITQHIIAVADDRLLMIYKDIKDLPDDISYCESTANSNNHIYHHGTTPDREYCFFDDRCLDVMKIRRSDDMIGKVITIEEKTVSDDPLFICDATLHS